MEALASEKKPEFVLMEDGKGRSINTTMLAVSCWLTGRCSVAQAHIMEGGKTGRLIVVRFTPPPFQYLTHEGKRYCLGLPVDSPMALLDSRGKPIDPSDEVRWQNLQSFPGCRPSHPTCMHPPDVVPALRLTRRPSPIPSHNTPHR